MVLFARQRRQALALAIPWPSTSTGQVGDAADHLLEVEAADQANVFDIDLLAERPRRGLAGDSARQALNLGLAQHQGSPL